MSSTTPSFASTVRSEMEQKGITPSELSRRAGITPSQLSRIITETEAARRIPQLEQVLSIARALELAPAELVAGTELADLLTGWISRDQFDSEVSARQEAQAEASRLRTEVAGLKSEIQALTREIDQMTFEVSKSSERELSTQREQIRLRVAQEAAEVRLTIAIQERDHALQLAEQNYGAWVEAQTWVLHLQKQVEESKGSAWLAGLFGAGVGAILSRSGSPVRGRHN